MFGMGPSHQGKTAAPAKAARAPRKAAAVSVTVRLEPRLKQKFEQLGGEAWLREQIERARVEAADGD